jgi:hypothetical protein
MFNLFSLVLFSLYCSSSYSSASSLNLENRLNDLYRSQGVHRLNFSADELARQQTNMVADKIRTQILSAYELAFNESGDTKSAKEQVLSAIERDLQLAESSIREEVLGYSVEVLNSIESGAAQSAVVDLYQTQNYLLKGLEAHYNLTDIEVDFQNPSPPLTKDEEMVIYARKKDLIESILSERPSTSYVSNASQTIRTTQVTVRRADISLQVKMEFLGAELAIGPTLSFRRELTTDATIMAEGLYPILLNDGSFDFFKRDKNGKIEQQMGKGKRRNLAFNCNASLNFQTEYEGRGGFKYLGAGATVIVGRNFENTVTLSSRRVYVPEVVEGKSVSLKFISELCEKDFMAAKIGDSLAIEKLLEDMMKNTVAGLRFTHERTNCGVSSDCANWFNKEISANQRNKNVARCVEEPLEKFRYCTLRGKEGQSCPVYSGTHRISSGDNEYPCDWGLHCKKIQDEHTFLGMTYQDAKGVCRKFN